MLVLRKEGMKRSRGGLLACLQHDSKLRMLKRERGEADDQAEGGHGDGDSVEEGGGRRGEKVEQAEDAVPAGIDRIDAEEAAAAQDDDEDVLFFARMSTEVEMDAVEEDLSESRKRQCVKDIWQGRAQRGEADGMRDGSEHAMK